MLKNLVAIKNKSTHLRFINIDSLSVENALYKQSKVYINMEKFSKYNRYTFQTMLSDVLVSKSTELYTLGLMMVVSR